MTESSLTDLPEFEHGEKGEANPVSLSPGETPAEIVETEPGKLDKKSPQFQSSEPDSSQEALAEELLSDGLSEGEASASARHLVEEPSGVTVEMVEMVPSAEGKEADPTSEILEEALPAEKQEVALSTEPSDAIAALREKSVQPRSKIWIALYLLASMVGGLSSVCIKQLLLPLQVSQLDPQTTYLSFLLVASSGAAAGLIASPLSGALSDRTTLRPGRRRSWIIGGVMTLGIGLTIMAFAPTIPILLIGEIIAQFGADALLAVETAIIPDQVSASQRAIISAFNGMAPIVGGTIGLLLVTRFTNTADTAQGYFLLAGVSVAMVGAFLLVFRERPLPRDLVPAFRLEEFLKSFWISPRRYPDFAYVVGSRCLIFLSFTVLGAYTLFYMRAVLHLLDKVASQNVATFQLLSTSAVLVGALLGGWLSRRADRLKPFVITGALLMATGLFLIVGIPSWPAMQLAALIFGSGFGLYLGVDIALAVRVLPDARSSGKDLGIMHMAIFLPLVLSPILGSGLLTLFPNNFTLLFSVAALSSVLGAGLIWPIKSVR
ncbi:MAG: MFS transporter [Ktedonobacteraceae bacterium]|nr:MFS transporter [Ktedonobacteraceae bacterium]